MRQRLVVMNGQYMIQGEQFAGDDARPQWHTDKVGKPGDIKPGVYNFYLSKDADKSKKHNGIILYADKSFVYQQTDLKSFVKHKVEDFDILPEVGRSYSIAYADNRAVVSAMSAKLHRGITN